MRDSARRLLDRAGTSVQFGLTFWAVLGFLALCAIVTLVASGDTADAAGAIGVMVGASLAGGLFITRAEALQGRDRVGWVLIGFGLCTAGLGVFVVAIVFFINGDAPAFGWTDLFFLATYILVIVGASILPQAHGTPMQRFRMVLDGLIGAISIAALLWVLVLADLTSDLADASTMTRVIGAAYPFLDLAVLTVAMSVLLRRSRHRFDLRIAMFAAGVLFQVAGDLTFFASGHSGSFEDANPLYWINLVAVGCFFTSAWLVGQPAASREYADRNPPAWTHVAAYVPAFGMLAVFVAEVILGGDASGDPILLPAVILVGLLVIARQAIAILENTATIEEQRDLLVTTISHELRTPLTSIVGFVELMEEDREHLTAQAAGMLSIIREQAAYMSTIVSDLIMLARGSEGALELSIEPVPAVELATASVQASGLGDGDVLTVIDPDIVLLVDRSRMQQLLINLLTNSARYGGPHTRLSIQSQNGDALIEIQDDGPGVPKRYEMRIWERFERGPNRLNAATPGSGIGLAIVRAIAEAHGGVAAYRTSEALGGACFSVVIPNCVADGNRQPSTDMDEAIARIRSIA